MSLVSYFCDTSKLGMSYLKGDYGEMKDEINDGKIKTTFSIEFGGEKFAYNIHKNEPLSTLYSFNVFMVDFVFTSIDTLHEKNQYFVLGKLMENLNEQILSKPAYYVFRIPTNIVDLLKSYNENFDKSVFCGGIVTYISMDKRIKERPEIKARIFETDKIYIRENKSELINIAKQAFEIYQGQYHISSVTEYKAGEIYTNWLKKAFDNLSETTKLLVSEFEGKPAAFFLYEEDELCGRGILGGVSSKFRKTGSYKGLLSEALNIASRSNKYLTTGTQFDNFIVQRAWGKMGMSPCTSYYNFHLDARNL